MLIFDAVLNGCMHQLHNVTHVLFSIHLPSFPHFSPYHCVPISFIHLHLFPFLFIPGGIHCSVCCLPLFKHAHATLIVLSLYHPKQNHVDPVFSPISWFSTLPFHATHTDCFQISISMPITSGSLTTTLLNHTVTLLLLFCKYFA